MFQTCARKQPPDSKKNCSFVYLFVFACNIKKSKKEECFPSGDGEFSKGKQTMSTSGTIL